MVIFKSVNFISEALGEFRDFDIVRILLYSSETLVEFRDID